MYMEFIHKKSATNLINQISRFTGVPSWYTKVGDVGEYEPPMAAVWYVVAVPRLPNDDVVSSVPEDRDLNVTLPLDGVDNLRSILPSSSPCSEVALTGDNLNNLSARLETLFALLGGPLSVLSWPEVLLVKKVDARFPALASRRWLVAELLLAPSPEPMDSMVGIRLTYPPKTRILCSGGYGTPNSL